MSLDQRILSLAQAVAADVKALSASKQDKLVSGDSIKTVGGQSLLGGGDIPTGAPIDDASITSTSETWSASKIQDSIEAVKQELSGALSPQPPEIQVTPSGGLSGNAGTSVQLTITNHVASWVYLVASNNTAVATVTVTGDQITVNFLTAGSATIEVSCRDPYRPTVRYLSIEATVYGIYGQADDIVQITNFGLTSAGYSGFALSSGALAAPAGSAYYASTVINQDAGQRSWASLKPTMVLNYAAASLVSVAKINNSLISTQTTLLNGQNYQVVDAAGSIAAGTATVTPGAAASAIPLDVTTNTQSLVPFVPADGVPTPFYSGSFQCRVFTFSFDGKWYYSADTDNRVIKFWRLNSPYDFSSILESGSVTLPSAVSSLNIFMISSLHFSPNGLNLYVGFRNSVSGSSTSTAMAYHGVLGTPFDIRTIVAISGRAFSAGMLSVATDTTQPNSAVCVCVSSDGNYAYISATSWGASSSAQSVINRGIVRYPLSTPFSLTSANAANRVTVYAGELNSIFVHFNFSANGQIIYLATRNNVYSSGFKYNSDSDRVLKLSVPWTGNASIFASRFPVVTSNSTSDLVGASGCAYLTPDATRIFQPTMRVVPASGSPYKGAASGLMSWSFSSIADSNTIVLSTPLNFAISSIYQDTAYTPDLRLGTALNGLTAHSAANCTIASEVYSVSAALLKKTVSFNTVVASTPNFNFVIVSNSDRAETISSISFDLTLVGA